MPAGARYWISEGMLVDRIYNADANGDGAVDHICFTVNNKFLHPNHPIGWVRSIKLKLDGQPVDREKVCFVLRDQWIPLKYMPTIQDVWWHANEDAWLYIESKGLEAGSRHEVECELALSLMVHNDNIDRQDLYPSLRCALQENMTVQEEVRA